MSCSCVALNTEYIFYSFLLFPLSQDGEHYNNDWSLGAFLLGRKFKYLPAAPSEPVTSSLTSDILPSGEHWSLVTTTMEYRIPREITFHNEYLTVIICFFSYPSS